MKITEVSYGRLFTLGEYNNERIHLRAIVEEEEDPNEVAGKLFINVLLLEHVFEKYRQVLAQIPYLEGRIDSTKGNIEGLDHRIQKMKVDLADLDRQLKAGGEIDDRLRHACSRQSLKELRENWKKDWEKLDILKEELEKAKLCQAMIHERINDGNFSIDDLDFPDIKQEKLW